LGEVFPRRLITKEPGDIDKNGVKEQGEFFGVDLEIIDVITKRLSGNF